MLNWIVWYVYIYKNGFGNNNLMYHKTKPNQTKQTNAFLNFKRIVKSTENLILQCTVSSINKYIPKSFILFTNPSARAGYDTRSIFKRSLTGLNSEFSFS